MTLVDTMGKVLRADEIDAGFVPQPREHIAAVDVEDEIVLYDEETGSMHLLNSSAAVVWKASDGTQPLTLLISDLAALYRVEPAAIFDQVTDLVREMGRHGLLAGVEADPAAAELSR
jgi:coenzyme PQQ synthesis protein D (PqqD)